jgi:hypothetical protein
MFFEFYEKVPFKSNCVFIPILRRDGTQPLGMRGIFKRASRQGVFNRGFRFN